MYEVIDGPRLDANYISDEIYPEATRICNPRNFLSVRNRIGYSLLGEIPKGTLHLSDIIFTIENNGYR